MSDELIEQAVQALTRQLLEEAYALPDYTPIGKCIKLGRRLYSQQEYLQEINLDPLGTFGVNIPAYDDEKYVGNPFKAKHWAHTLFKVNNSLLLASIDSNLVFKFAVVVDPRSTDDILTLISKADTKSKLTIAESIIVMQHALSPLLGALRFFNLPRIRFEGLTPSHLKLYQRAFARDSIVKTLSGNGYKVTIGEDGIDIHK